MKSTHWSAHTDPADWADNPALSPEDAAREMIESHEDGHASYLRRKERLHAMGLTSNGKLWNPRPRLTMDQAIADAADRFWQKVSRGDGCWLWMAGKNRQGYGKFVVGGKTIGAHRIAYRLEHGSMPDSLVLHHCDNPQCVRPDHLFTGTPADNMADKVVKGRQARGAKLSAALLGKVKALRGSDCHQAKLTEADIPHLRAMHAAGDGLSVIAARFSVSKQAVLNAARRKTWRHVA